VPHLFQGFAAMLEEGAATLTSAADFPTCAPRSDAEVLGSVSPRSLGSTQSERDDRDQPGCLGLISGKPLVALGL
jgi:hypothetical protein